MSEPLRALGLIGPGRHGSRYLQERNGGRYFTRVLSRTPRTDLPDWVKGTTDPEEFFAPGLDGVVIATPSPEHVGQTSHCLMRGLHVLCEKPLSQNLSDALFAVALAESRGLRLLVAHTDLFHSAWRPRRDMPVKAAVSVFSGPGLVNEWSPHAIATLLDITTYNGNSVSRRGDDLALHFQMQSSAGTSMAELHAKIEIGEARCRKAFANYGSGRYFAFDGNAHPTPRLSETCSTSSPAAKKIAACPTTSRARYVACF